MPSGSRFRDEFLREWWPGTESSRRHGDFQSPALPTELPGQTFRLRVRRHCAGEPPIKTVARYSVKGGDAGREIKAFDRALVAAGERGLRGAAGLDQQMCQAKMRRQRRPVMPAAGAAVVGER